MASHTSASASGHGLPASNTSRAATSSRLARSQSAARNSTAHRRGAGVPRQPSSAADAVATASSASAAPQDADRATTTSHAPGSTEVMVDDVRTRCPPIIAGTSSPKRCDRTAMANDVRTSARRHSRCGSWWYGPGAAGSVAGRRTGGSRSGSEASAAVGEARRSARSRPSANRWRTKLSLEVFSSSRRTR